jgi:hypothetical protein
MQHPHEPRVLLRVERPLFWFLIALVVRTPVFVLLLLHNGYHQSLWGWGAENGDTWSYFDPIDALIEGRGYSPDFRMPGYGIPYWLFRQVTAPPGAGTLIVLAQSVLSALSCVALRAAAREMGLSVRAANIVFWGYAVFPRLIGYDVAYFPESFCISAMIIALHGWLVTLRTFHRGSALWCGAWLAWAVFLKPVMGLWLPFIALGAALSQTTTFRTRMATASLLLLPFIIADGAWSFRNWRADQRFHPLNNGFLLPWLTESNIYPVMRYMQAIGGNYIWWDPTADIRWFNVREGENNGPGRRKDEGVRMPRFALTEHCTEDSLLTLANELQEYSGTNDAGRARLKPMIKARCDRYIRSYEEIAPFQYHVAARLRLTTRFFGMAGSASLFGDDRVQGRWYVRALDGFERVWYWIIVPLGLLATFLALLRRTIHPRMRLFALAVLVNLFVHPWILRFCEGRYLMPLIPWLLLFALLMLDRMRLNTAG